jgi:hypothetical protein
MPEYIRPGTVSSTLAVTPAAVEVHNNVRWVCLIWGLRYNSQVGLGGHLAAASPALRRQNTSHQILEAFWPGTSVQEWNLDREATFLFTCVRKSHAGR